MTGTPLGKRLIAGLEQIVKDIESGKPIKQTIARRMSVKGKTVYTFETFTGPLQSSRRKR